MEVNSSHFDAICARFTLDHDRLRTLDRLLERATDAVQEPLVETFLEYVDLETLGVTDVEILGKVLVNAVERFMCLGDESAPKTDFVRVVSAVSFLCYYSGRYIPIVDKAMRRNAAQAGVEELKAILRAANRANFALVTDYLLPTGHLRRPGSPCWLACEADVRMCKKPEEYLDKLALPSSIGVPLIRMEIGLRHLRSTGTRHSSAPAYDPNDKMTTHIPTVVDGYDHSLYVHGGLTAGGIAEYASRLDNVDALDWMEVVE